MPIYHIPWRPTQVEKGEVKLSNEIKIFFETTRKCLYKENMVENYYL